MEEFMLTTIDNPFNPFTQFDEWYRYDLGMHYGTCGYLARIAKITQNMTDEEEEEEINRAMDEICEVNPLGIHKKVTRNDYKNGKWHPKRFVIEEKFKSKPVDTPSEG